MSLETDGKTKDGGMHTSERPLFQDSSTSAKEIGAAFARRKRRDRRIVM